MKALAVPARTDLGSRRRSAWRALAPLMPVLVFLGVLFVFPVAQLLWLSVVDDGGTFTATHYSRLFDSNVYVKVLGITFRIAAWTTLICVLAGYPVAYLLATARDGTRNMLILWVLMPFWTSFLVRTFAWMVLLGRRGAINEWMQALGLTDAPMKLIYNFAGVMIGMVHALMPLAIVTMLAVMRNIDQNLTPGRELAGSAGRAVLLARVLSAFAARRGLERPAGIYRRTRLLHHSRPAGERARDHDCAGHHRADGGVAQLEFLGRGRGAAAGRYAGGVLRLRSALRPVYRVEHWRHRR